MNSDWLSIFLTILTILFLCVVIVIAVMWMSLFSYNLKKYIVSIIIVIVIVLGLNGSSLNILNKILTHFLEIILNNGNILHWKKLKETIFTQKLLVNFTKKISQVVQLSMTFSRNTEILVFSCKTCSNNLCLHFLIVDMFYHSITF